MLPYTVLELWNKGANTNSEKKEFEINFILKSDCVIAFTPNMDQGSPYASTVASYSGASFRLLIKVLSLHFGFWWSSDWKLFDTFQHKIVKLHRMF